MKLPHLTVTTDKLWKQEHGPRWNDAVGKSLGEAHLKLQAKFKSGAVGFYDWPTQVKSEDVRRMEALAAKIRSEFEGALLFGIGGSYLGPAAILEAMAPGGAPGFPLSWVSNVDPGEIRRAESQVEKNKLAAVVMSKSGGTIETLSSFFHLSAKLPPEGYVFITDPKVGELRRLATENDWATLPISPNIGGRFSVLTPVGLFPILLAGLSAEKLIIGAKSMREALDALSPAENPAYRLAAAMFEWDTKFKHTVHYLMPYEKRLKFLADWYVQLWGESLGKKGMGFTPASALGSTDQHSLLQLMKEGPRDKVVGFVEVLEDGAEIKVKEPPFAVKGQEHVFKHTFGEITHFASLATEQSLNNSGMPTYRIEFERVDEAALGAFFFFYETSCALAGELYGVDAFDQPGVEEAKKLLRAAM